MTRINTALNRLSFVFYNKLCFTKITIKQTNNINNTELLKELKY